MRKVSMILCLLLSFCIFAYGEVDDTFSRNGIRYQVTKENPASQAFEVSAVYYDSAYILLPDSVANGEYTYAVTNAVQWYNPQSCALRHYYKIDMSAAKHITSLTSQRSGLIAIDTLILPPNLERFPSWFHTTDSLNWRTRLMDAEKLLPGIHRIWSTGTQALEDIRLQSCTSLLEADLSTYTTTFANLPQQSFVNNPFLERLVIPNTITTFSGEMFYGDNRLTDLNIPDSLTSIYNILTDILPLDTLRLGKNVSYIDCVFADGWHDLKHIEVDSANPYFMDDDGVLYTKNQSTLKRYPFTRDGGSYRMSPKTDSLCRFAFAYFWPEVIISYMWPPGAKNQDNTFASRIKALVDSIPLKELECSTSLTYLGEEGTFSGTSIRIIHRFEENRVKEIPIQCFMYATIDSIALPFGLTDIETEAFAYTYNLRTISNLSRLRDLRFIGAGGFRDAWKLEEIDLLPCDKLKEIPQFMCCNDSALRFVSLPRNVQSIGDGAFKNCGSLQQIICPALVPISIDSSVFEGVDKQNCVLKVPARSLFLYQNAPVWKEFFQIDTEEFYYIETAVSDTLAGYVTGGGAYMRGDMATISAEANKGYRFVSWSDGYQYSTRIMIVTKDESFTAIFEPIPIHTLTVVANDDTMGSVTGSGEYEEGAEVTLTATPNEGYSLMSWSFLNKAIDTVSYIMPTTDTVVTAYFAPLQEAFETVETTTPSACKILRDGRLFILRAEKTYTAQGQEVK